MAEKKRADGEGTVFQRLDGKWVGRTSLGRNSAGKRQQKTVYGKTQKEALAKLDNLRQQAKLSQIGIVSKIQ